MKKSLIALAVLAASGAAMAQSSVTLYGKLDVSVGKKDSSNGPVVMDHNHNSRWGLKGSEDLGGGLSATFQLENRFFADTGASKDPYFQAQSNVGLKGGFGYVRLGRIYNPVDDIAGGLDPFGQDGVAGMQVNSQTKTRQDNSVRYDSPTFGGFGVQAIVSAAETGVAKANHGAGLAVTYAAGPLYLAAGANRTTNAFDSQYAGIGGSYVFGPAKLSAYYDEATVKNGTPTEVKEKNFMIGLAYAMGPGVINANYGELKKVDNTDKKFGLGYTYNMSKRTSFYADVGHTKLAVKNAFGDDTVTGYELGVTHNF